MFIRLIKHLGLIGLIAFSSLTSCTQPANDLKIEQVSDDLYVYTTYGVFEGVKYAANAMYMVTSKGIVVFDCPWEPIVNEAFKDELYKRHHLPIIADIATHWHQDRAGGIDFFKQIGAKTYTSKATDSILKKEGKPQAEFTFNNDTTFTIGGKSFNIFYPGKGHTADNVVVWFSEEQILLGGCIIKNADAKNLGNISEAYPDEWDDAIRRLQKRYADAKLIVAGHDDWHPQNGLQHTLDLLKAYQEKQN